MALPRATGGGTPRIVTVGEASEILHVHLTGPNDGTVLSKDS